MQEQTNSGRNLGLYIIHLYISTQIGPMNKGTLILKFNFLKVFLIFITQLKNRKVIKLNYIYVCIITPYRC